MTMTELAKLANVSLSTVSKAFGSANDISEQTRAHILELAKQTGCFWKFCKEKYPKASIAVICPELKGNHYPMFLNELTRLSEASNCICSIAVDNFNPEKQAELIEYYATYLKVDGLIVFGLQTPLKKG